MKGYDNCIPEITLKYKSSEVEKTKICSPEDCIKIIRKMFDADTLEYREEFLMLLLNRGNFSIGWMKISMGGTAGTIVDPKIIFTTALKAGAHAIILAHNHPSGNCMPSAADISLTKQISEGGKLLSIDVLDHFIICKDEEYSFLEKGLI